MNDIQSELKVLLEKDNWEVFISQSKTNSVIMQKKIKGIVYYISIREDGAVHFNRRK